MIQARLNRLFGADGRCFDVAIDHGLFDEPSFLAGIESLPKAVAVVADAMPDAIQLPPGGSRILQGLARPKKPALVMRTDIANVYGTPLPERVYSILVDDAVEQALRLDAACVVVNLLKVPGQPELLEQCVRNAARLKPQCERWGMPLMIEPLNFRDNFRGGYGTDTTLEKIVPLVRQAAEIGADVIKADPSDDPAQYGAVIETAGDIPVLVRGGGRVSDEEILSRTEALLKTGAKGIVYGRNVIQHPNPAGMVRALMSVLHDGVSATEAATTLASS